MIRIMVMAGMWENVALLRGDLVCLIRGVQGRGPILFSRLDLRVPV